MLGGGAEGYAQSVCCSAEGGGSASSGKSAMSSGFFPGPYGSPFDDFFARYGGGPGGPRQRIDITQFLSERARDLVNAAARRAAEVGSPDLDTDHLLWAMTEEESTRHLISRAGADPAQLRDEIGARPGHGEPRGEAPALTPAAK